MGKAPHKLCSRLHHPYAVAHYNAMVLPQHCIKKERHVCLPGRFS